MSSLNIGQPFRNDVKERCVQTDGRPWLHLSSRNRRNRSDVPIKVTTIQACPASYDSRSLPRQPKPPSLSKKPAFSRRCARLLACSRAASCTQSVSCPSGTELQRLLLSSREQVYTYCRKVLMVQAASVGRCSSPLPNGFGSYLVSLNFSNLLVKSLFCARMCIMKTLLRFRNGRASSVIRSRRIERPGE